MNSLEEEINDIFKNLANFMQSLTQQLQVFTKHDLFKKKSEKKDTIYMINIKFYCHSLESKF